jgi:Ni/Co efflux regulator RcnB
MKTTVLIAALALALPFAASAQTAEKAKPAAKSTTAKPAPKAAAKPAAKTTTAKATPKKKPQVTRRAAKAVEEVTPIDTSTDIALSEADLAIAQRVQTGKIQCELGADVTVTADDKKPGFFNVSTKGKNYRMHPVESRTGAIRLEDPRAGAMWLQIANKSMLMNQKEGLRLADECMAPAQMAFAEEMKKNPPKSLFEGADQPAGVARK